MNIFKKLSKMWETRQQASILCGDMELLRHINYWVRYENLGCGFYSLMLSVPFVRDNFFSAHGYDKENNTFLLTNGSMGDKTIVVKLLPHRVIVTPMDDMGKDFVYRIKCEESYYNGKPIKEYRLVEVE